MQYYLINTNIDSVHIPKIKHIYSKLNIKDVVEMDYVKFRDRELLPLLEDKHIIFPDVCFVPFPLLSKRFMAVLNIYEKHLLAKQIILLEEENSITELYCLPLLSSIKALASIECLSRDRKRLIGGRLIKSKLAAKAVFCISELKSPHLVIREDVLESLLYRNIFGFYYNEIIVEED